MKCPECHTDSGYRVVKEAYNKTPESIIKRVSCDNCGGEYDVETKVKDWKGGGVVD